MNDTDNALSEFFGILEDGSIRKIPLTQNLVSTIRATFVKEGMKLLIDVEHLEFSANYTLNEDEVNFVRFQLPEAVTNAVANPIGTLDLNLRKEDLKTLFWHSDGTYFFQCFDKRRLLRNKNVLIYSNQTYGRLENDAFIIDDNVQAAHRNGLLYFTSYANANKIFSLVEFFRQASDEEIRVFATHGKIQLDKEWFVNNATPTLRKHIAVLSQSGILDKADTGKIRKQAKRFRLNIDLDADGKICFPNDKKQCKDLLFFLNEQFWSGLISGQKFRTNSKRTV